MEQMIGVLPLSEIVNMKRDAERYRWLRKQDSETTVRVFVDQGGRRVQRSFADLDDVIDAQLSSNK